MITAYDSEDDDIQSIIRSSCRLPGILGYQTKKDLGLLNEGQSDKYM